MKRFTTVDEYILNSGKWQEALIHLRDIPQTTSLIETVKWGIPVYTHKTKNVVGMAAFKSYVGIWFYQGALLKDDKKKLINAQEGVTKALRQWRFGSLQEIIEETENIKDYIKEAILNVEQGKEIKPEKDKALLIPDELLERLDSSAGLQECFKSLTLSKQREYAEYILAAKRAETKSSRIEKIVPMILDNVGLNDKYRS